MLSSLTACERLPSRPPKYTLILGALQPMFG
jgi:hypothetical protein